jgi:pimeloyl-ACP methyl ester carboxylesterase
MQDEALLLGPQQSNVAVFTPAELAIDTRANTAVLCLTAGLLHHVGPHRLHVLLARALAKQGFATLRFDFSGIGDSATRADDVPAQDIPVTEIGEAITELETRGFTRFILFGICSGAVQAAKAAEGNPKISGLVLLNTGDDDGSASSSKASVNVAADYYLKRSLWNPQAWKNLFTGKVKYRDLFVTLFSVLIRKVTAQITGKGKTVATVEQGLQQGVQPFIEQGTSILAVLSDRHAQFYALHREAFDELEGPLCKTLVFPETDHLFSSLSAQKDLIDQVCQWACQQTDKTAQQQ